MSVVTFTGVDTALAGLITQAQTSWSGMGADVLALSSVAGIPACLGNVRGVDLHALLNRLDRKSTRSELQSPMYLVCRLLLEKKNVTDPPAQLRRETLPHRMDFVSQAANGSDRAGVRNQHDVVRIS